MLLHKVDEELTHEKAIRVAAYETDLKENCDGIARNLHRPGHQPLCC